MNAEDNQTLTSFAAVKFDKKVDNWKITETLAEEQERRRTLPDLVAEGRAKLEAALADNKKACKRLLHSTTPTRSTRSASR